MLTTVFEIIAIVAVLVGTAFSIIGTIGLIRLPDVYTRMHAIGKVSTFGISIILLGAVVLVPGGWARALILIALLLIGGPVVSHALGSAALRIGIPMKGAVRNDLGPAAKVEK
jgi:multicomponent Na+:H+ antiporter subunit G